MNLNVCLLAVNLPIDEDRIVRLILDYIGRDLGYFFAVQAFKLIQGLPLLLGDLHCGQNSRNQLSRNVKLQLLQLLDLCARNDQPGFLPFVVVQVENLQVVECDFVGLDDGLPAG